MSQAAQRIRYAAHGLVAAWADHDRRDSIDAVAECVDPSLRADVARMFAHPRSHAIMPIVATDQVAGGSLPRSAR